jgi:hypothetical protein
MRVIRYLHPKVQEIQDTQLYYGLAGPIKKTPDMAVGAP